jgi:hypothetical protein
MAVLHDLARRGNMQDIARYANHLEQLDPDYRPFAEQLRRYASQYQSKALLAFVECYLPDGDTG